MKKLIAIAGATLVALSGYSQGTMTASGSGLINSRTGSGLIVGTTFRVGLYYLPDQVAPPTSADFDQRGTLLGPTVGISPLAGRYSIGIRSTPSTTAGGGEAWFQVRAWESAFGATWAEVMANPNNANAIAGTSTIVKVASGNPASDPPGTPGAVAVPGFVLNPVPEPSVIGLGLLGVGSLLLLRRRK
jgi:hypothetical protein